MKEHNQVNCSPIRPYLPVLSNHTIGHIQVVIQVKLPVLQYVPLSLIPFFLLWPLFLLECLINLSAPCSSYLV